MLLPYQLVQQLGVPSPANRASHALFDPSLNPSALAVLTCEQFQYWPWSPHQRLATSPQPPRPHDQRPFKKGRLVICPCRSFRSGHKPVAQLETHPTTSSKHLQESWSSCSPLEVSNRSSYPSGPSFEDKSRDSATALALLSHSQPTLGQHPSNKHRVSSIVALCTYLGQPITKGFNTYRSIPSNTRCSHFAYSKLLIGPLNTHLRTTQTSDLTRIFFAGKLLNFLDYSPTPRIQNLLQQSRCISRTPMPLHIFPSIFRPTSSCIHKNMTINPTDKNQGECYAIRSVLQSTYQRLR